MPWKKAWMSGLSVAGALLGVLLMGFASQLWASREDHQNRITTLEADAKTSHDLLWEVRQDVKELLKRVGDGKP